MTHAEQDLLAYLGSRVRPQRPASEDDEQRLHGVVEGVGQLLALRKHIVAQADEEARQGTA